MPCAYAFRFSGMVKSTGGSFLNGGKAVSYTHLDVYKRQLYNCVVEATLLYQRLHSDQNSFVGYIDRIKDSYPFLQDWLHYAGYDLERIKSLLTKAALSASSFLARNTVTLGENTLGFLTNLALVLYIAFFLLMDGTKIQELLIKALPFGDCLLYTSRCV